MRLESRLARLEALQQAHQKPVRTVFVEKEETLEEVYAREGPPHKEEQVIVVEFV
jgi:hypothetical protein